MSDLNEVWNTNRTQMTNNSLANSSFPRNQLGPSYAPYTQEEVSGVYAGCEQSPYQPKNIYSTTLGMSPAIITPEYLNTLFSNDYFLKLLGEFMLANNMTTIKEGFSLNSFNVNYIDIIFKVLVIIMMIIILFKVK